MRRLLAALIKERPTARRHRRNAHANARQTHRDAVQKDTVGLDDDGRAAIARLARDKRQRAVERQRNCQKGTEDNRTAGAGFDLDHAWADTPRNEVERNRRFLSAIGGAAIAANRPAAEALAFAAIAVRLARGEIVEAAEAGSAAQTFALGDTRRTGQRTADAETAVVALFIDVDQSVTATGT